MGFYSYFKIFCSLNILLRYCDGMQYNVGRVCCKISECFFNKFLKVDFASLCNGYFGTLQDSDHFTASTIAPVIINPAPTISLTDMVSFKKSTDKMMAMATLSLSTGATWDTLPICNALK